MSTSRPRFDLESRMSNRAIPSDIVKETALESIRHPLETNRPGG